MTKELTRYVIHRNNKCWLPTHAFMSEKQAWSWLSKEEAYGLDRDIFPSKKELIKGGWSVEPYKLVRIK